MRFIGLGISIALICSSPVAAQQTTPIRKDDPEMNAAIVRAKQTLETFFQVRAAGESGNASFVVKVMLSRGSDLEQVWVWPFRAAGTGYEGILKSHPRFAPELKFGQQITFAREQITDWGYTKNGKNIGYRTMCVVLKRDEGAKAHAKQSGLEYECAP